jgi:hypothetical protein
MDIQYVTDKEGKRIAVQIPVEQWEVIKAELESCDGETETAEILADTVLMKSIEKGRHQARQTIGRRIEEIDV